MQERILKHMLTLFFAAALLLAMEGILISRGENKPDEEKHQPEIKQPEKPHQKLKINIQ
jgi:hypothetical protein